MNNSRAKGFQGYDPGLERIIKPVQRDRRWKVFIVLALFFGVISALFEWAFLNELFRKSLEEYPAAIASGLVGLIVLVIEFTKGYLLVYDGAQKEQIRNKEITDEQASYRFFMYAFVVLSFVASLMFFGYNADNTNLASASEEVRERTNTLYQGFKSELDVQYDKRKEQELDPMKNMADSLANIPQESLPEYNTYLGTLGAKKKNRDYLASQMASAMAQLEQSYQRDTTGASASEKSAFSAQFRADKKELKDEWDGKIADQARIDNRRIRTAKANLDKHIKSIRDKASQLGDEYLAGQEKLNQEAMAKQKEAYDKYTQDMQGVEDRIKNTTAADNRFLASFLSNLHFATRGDYVYPRAWYMIAYFLVTILLTIIVEGSIWNLARLAGKHRIKDRNTQKSNSHESQTGGTFNPKNTNKPDDDGFASKVKRDIDNLDEVKNKLS